MYTEKDDVLLYEGCNVPFNTTVLVNEELFISEGDYQALKDAVEDVTRQISGIILKDWENKHGI